MILLIYFSCNYIQKENEVKRGGKTMWLSLVSGIRLGSSPGSILPSCEIRCKFRASVF